MDEPALPTHIVYVIYMRGLLYPIECTMPRGEASKKCREILTKAVSQTLGEKGQYFAITLNGNHVIRSDAVIGFFSRDPEENPQQIMARSMQKLVDSHDHGEDWKE